MITYATTSDIELLLRLRMEVIADVFAGEPADTEALRRANALYLRQHLADGTHMAYVARDGENIAGCGAMCFYMEMPSPDNPSGLCAYLMSIYVRPPYRRRGIASEIVRRLVAEARSRDAGKIYLETTPKAEKMYTSLGFTPLRDYMKL